MSWHYSVIMRTTVRLNDQLFMAAKRAAVERNITLTKLIEEALREKLSEQHRAVPERSFQVVTFNGDGVQPGIDLDDSAALLATMED